MANPGIIANRAPQILLALAVVGIAIAFYDSYSIYTHRPLWCPPPVSGCNVVVASPYAYLFGLPIGYFGLIYYLNMFGLAALLAFDPASRGLRIGTALWAFLGFFASLCFLVLQAGFIHAFCIYCAASGMTTVLLSITAALHMRASKRA